VLDSDLVAHTSLVTFMFLLLLFCDCLFRCSNIHPIYLSKLIYSEEFHKGKLDIPDTKVGEEGSSKRNIQRKHDHDPHRKPKPQHGGAGGKGKWNDVDDGTFDEE
jgi:hypothetical protein